MNKSFHFLSRLSGPLNKQYKRRSDTVSRFWRFWVHVQDFVVKVNRTLTPSSSQFITSSVPSLIKFSSVTPEPQTIACWMLQSKSSVSGPALKVTVLQADRLLTNIRYEKFPSLLTQLWLFKELHGKKRIFLVFLVLLQILHGKVVECGLSWMGSMLELSVKPGLCLSCWFAVLPSSCFSVWLKEPGTRCLLGRHPDSVNIFDFRGRLKIKLFCVTSSIIRPGCIASYGILFQKWLESMR